MRRPGVREAVDTLVVGQRDDMLDGSAGSMESGYARIYRRTAQVAHPLVAFEDHQVVIPHTEALSTAASSVSSILGATLLGIQPGPFAACGPTLVDVLVVVRPAQLPMRCILAFGRAVSTSLHGAELGVAVSTPARPAG